MKRPAPFVQIGLLVLLPALAFSGENLATDDLAPDLDTLAFRNLEPGRLLAANLGGGEDGKTRGLGFYLLLGAVGGLILNLMPCVLPVVSLKVLSLVAQAGEERWRIRQLGLAFVAGIIASFLGLAAVIVALKLGGQQIGWGFQFQYPGFVIAMTTLVFALGLSLFGVFTVNLPGGQGRLSGLADRPIILPEVITSELVVEKLKEAAAVSEAAYRTQQ